MNVRGGGSWGRRSSRHTMCSLYRQQRGKGLSPIRIDQQVFKKVSGVLTFCPLRETDKTEITPPQSVLHLALQITD